MNIGARNRLCSVAFLLTGVGTALLGATLPATLGQWQLSDSRGGLLLLAGWGGSTSGALFARGRLDRSAAVGLTLTSLSLFALSGRRPAGLLLLYLIYGVGLGLTMTAISLLRSREASPAEADLDLNRLNLLWAAGACLSPVLALHSLRMLSIATLYRTMGSVFVLTAAAIGLVSLPPHSLPSRPDAGVTPPLAWAPLRFGLFAAATVGMESAIGSWLTTFAERTTFGVGTAVSANSAFWLGLLFSRAAHSLRTAAWLHTRSIRTLHVLAVGIATALLLLIPSRTIIPVAGFVCGFGLGPLYPYVLSLTLPNYRSTSVFVLAGVGASVVPWLTGALSTAAGSLRIGLLVPALTFAVLVLSAIAIQAAARSSSAVCQTAIDC